MNIYTFFILDQDDQKFVKFHLDNLNFTDISHPDFSGAYFVVDTIAKHYYTTRNTYSLLNLDNFKAVFVDKALYLDENFKIFRSTKYQLFSENKPFILIPPESEFRTKDFNALEFFKYDAEKATYLKWDMSLSQFVECSAPIGDVVAINSASIPIYELLIGETEPVVCYPEPTMFPIDNQKLLEMFKMFTGHDLNLDDLDKLEKCRQFLLKL